MARAILPNWFEKVQTAVEIDNGAGAALDCVVLPQRIDTGTGLMIDVGTQILRYSNGTIWAVVATS